MEIGKYLGISFFEPMGVSSCKKCKGTGFVRMYWLELLIKCIIQKTPLKYSRKTKWCSCMFYGETMSHTTMKNPSGEIISEEDFDIR